MIVHSVGEGEEILNVVDIVVQVYHWVLDSDIPLFGMSVHSGGRAENVNYRIQMMIRGFMSDAMYLAYSSDCF